MKHNMERDSMEKATERPWKVVRFEMSHESEVSNGVKIVSCDNGYTIADNETYYPHAITEPNAAIIVRAVNSHEALIEALERSNKHLKQARFLLSEETAAYAVLTEVIEQNAEALKLARGE